MFAVKPTGGTEPVEDDSFVFRRIFLIAKKDCLGVFDDEKMIGMGLLLWYSPAG